MRCGIEFEYLLVDTDGPTAGRVRDFGNLDFAELSRVLENKPGRDDPGLPTGDLGIKSGYWYLEGDERFHEDGRFRTLAVKGVEIRTPPATNVREAVLRLLDIERQLSGCLAAHGLGLGIAGFNPVRDAYAFEPPLNAWEQALRQRHRAYDGSLVSTLSYGPDINLSVPGWSPQRNLQAARKLNAYAPYLVPFSFSSPFFAGQPWQGCSKRTWERAPLRPAVKLYLDASSLSDLGEQSQLVYPARLAHEDGRLEFKAFDAFVSTDLLLACSYLLVGVCLDDELPRRSESPDLDLYRRAALAGLRDPMIHDGARELLTRVRFALIRDGQGDAADALEPLESLMSRRSTPADALRADGLRSGRLYYRTGLADTPLPACLEFTGCI